MKFVIDIPENAKILFLRDDMAEIYYITNDGHQIEYGYTKIVPYEDQEELKVGDEVTDGEHFGYVLIPDYVRDNCVILIDEYSCPQIVSKSDWKRTGRNNKEIARFVKLSVEALDKKQL